MKDWQSIPLKIVMKHILWSLTEPTERLNKQFKDIIDYFDGDVMVLNNTKVFQHVYLETKKNRR